MSGVPRSAPVEPVYMDTADSIVEEHLHAFQRATEAQRYQILRRLVTYLSEPVHLSSLHNGETLTRCMALFKKNLPPSFASILPPLTLQRSNIRKMAKAFKRLQDPAVPFERVIFDMTCIETGQRIRFSTGSIPEEARRRLQTERERQAGLAWGGILPYLSLLFDQIPDEAAARPLRLLAEGIAWEQRKQDHRGQWLWGVFLSNGQGAIERISLSVFEGGTGRVTLLATRIDDTPEGEQFRMAIEHARWAAIRYLQRLTAGFRDKIPACDMLLKIGEHYQAQGYKGASLGLPLTVMIVAHFLRAPLDHATVLTGEIDQEGRVAGVSGIPGKVRAALSRGVRRVIVPMSNAAEGMKAARDGVQVVGVRTVEEACDLLFRDLLMEKGYRAFPMAAASYAGKKRPGGHNVPFIGRAGELQSLQQRINRALSGDGNFTIIAGEAGIGKTRLLEEVRTYARQTGMEVFCGYCFYQQSIPYMPFLDALTSAESPRSDGADASSLKHETAQLHQFVEGLRQGDHTERSLLTSMQIRLFEHITDILQPLLQERSGILLCIEDLQWADSGSLQLLHYLARRIPGQRICLIGTYRTEEVAHGDEARSDALKETLGRLSNEGLSETISLDLLDAEEIRRMVEATLDHPVASARISDRVYHESSGNPLFALELLKFWQESGGLPDAEAGWKEVPESRDAIPPRIYDLIERRVNRLGEEDRELLEIAAVGGARFYAEDLVRIHDARRIDTLRQLHRLERRQGVIASLDGGMYMFAHEKIREVLYRELPETLRQEYHAAWGRVLLARKQNGDEAPAEVLALHLYKGGDDIQALPYLREAAENARRVNALRESRWYWERVDAILSRQEGADASTSRIEAWLRLGWVLSEQGEWAAATARYKEALAAARRIGDEKFQAQALMRMGAILFFKNKLDAAMRLFERSLRLYSACEDQHGIACAWVYMGLVCKNRARYDEARRYYHKALELSQEMHDEYLMAVTLGNLGILAMLEGDNESAIRFHEESRSRHQQTGNMLGVAESTNNSGIVHEREENWDEALICYRKGMELYERIGIPRHLGICYINYARILSTRTGDLTLAEEMCRKGREIVTGLGSRRGLAEAARVDGLIASLQDDWETAERWFDESERLSRESDEPYEVAETYRERAYMLFRRGDVQQALGAMGHAERIFQEIGARADVAIVQRKKEAMKNVLQNSTLRKK